jgi:hypothetical protein
MRKSTYVFEIIDEAAFDKAFCAEESPDALLASLGVRMVATASGDHLRHYEALTKIDKRMDEWKAGPEYEALFQRACNTLFPPDSWDAKAEIERIHARLDALEKC